MANNVRARLRLEALETRTNPNATVSLVAGNLTIVGDNTPNGVELFGSPISVYVNGDPYGPFNVTGNVNIILGSSDDLHHIFLIFQ